MNTKKQPEPTEPLKGISEHREEWIRLFMKHLELNVLDASRDLLPDAKESELRVAMARAILATYFDSGLEVESALELFGQAAVERGTRDSTWNEALNQRRFELIDKKIQGELTPAESVELAGLTGIMRNCIDSEANVPMKGAQALHRKLLNPDSAGGRG